MSKIHAPVALFVFNRPQHTQRTLEALRRNTQAGETDLYIFSDGPRSDLDRPSVEAVRNLLAQGVKGFRSVAVTNQEKNLGLSGSVIDGVTQVVRSRGRVIVVEDDLETSPYFLQYMNDGLDLYENDKDVISIHGYLYPLKIDAPETFFLKGADCWGWATWNRGWDLFEPDAGKLLQELRSRGLEHAFDLDGAYPYTQMLKDQCDHEIDSWAIRWHASAFLKDKVTLYPGRSMVHNIGHDDTGAHSGTSSAFDVRLSQTPVRVERIPLVHNELLWNEVSRYWSSIRPTFVQRAIGRMRRLIRRTPQ